jgi:hypothetical protein
MFFLANFALNSNMSNSGLIFLFIYSLEHVLQGFDPSFLMR